MGGEATARAMAAADLRSRHAAVLLHQYAMDAPADELPETYRDAIRAVLAERSALAERVAELEAIVAEGNQRDRALALLLLRNGGQVEFTQIEQVNAPSRGELISYPNLATGGLVLAYLADGKTVGAAPQQPVRDTADGAE